MDWASVLPPDRCSYVLGNPSFLGKSDQSAAQKADMQMDCGDIKNVRLLDFVAAWYVKAVRYLSVIASNEVARKSIETSSGLLRHDVPCNDKQIATIESAQGTSGAG